ncbi:MAG: DUF4258 domain-containing protein [Proteobacteria bacterium]|nr:DUF4258 domain-containing protein [Pseudomonadota bacterium]
MDKLPPKISGVLSLIQERTRSGAFIILPHATFRREERQITVSDIAFVLMNGDREPSKDEFKVEFGSWNYAMRGQTVDSRNLRIAVTFDEGEMLIVTVIPLGKRRS